MSVGCGSVAGVNTPLDPVLQGLTVLARQESDRFDRKNLRVRRSAVVHAVRMVAWVGGLSLPAPACGQGWSGAGMAELHPVVDAVNCHHCLGSAAARAAMVENASAQIPLPLPLR